MLVALQEKSEKHDHKMKQHIEDITINLDDITCFFSYANHDALCVAKEEELTESNTKFLATLIMHQRC